MIHVIANFTKKTNIRQLSWHRNKKQERRKRYSSYHFGPQPLNQCLDTAIPQHTLQVLCTVWPWYPSPSLVHAAGIVRGVVRRGVLNISADLRVVAPTAARRSSTVVTRTRRVTAKIERSTRATTRRSASRTALLSAPSKHLQIDPQLKHSTQIR